jgi:hypothetical protein
MKATLTALTTILLFTTILGTSCKKDTEPVPDYPQLMGLWTGTTSQGVTIFFVIGNIDGILYVTHYKMTVYTNNGYQTYEQYNTDGIVSLSGRGFNIPLGTGSAGPAFISGNFDLDSMVLDGSFAVYPSGNTIDIITGTYSASKTQ